MANELVTASIYAHIHKVTKTAYVGQAKDPKKRFGKDGHGYTADGKNINKAFAEAIKKDGFDAFEHKILFTLENRTKEEIDFYEALTMELFARRGEIYNTTRPLRSKYSLLGKETMEALFESEPWLQKGLGSVDRWINQSINDGNYLQQEFMAWMEWCDSHPNARIEHKKFYDQRRKGKQNEL